MEQSRCSMTIVRQHTQTHHKLSKHWAAAIVSLWQEYKSKRSSLRTTQALNKAQTASQIIKINTYHTRNLNANKQGFIVGL